MLPYRRVGDIRDHIDRRLCVSQGRRVFRKLVRLLQIEETILVQSIQLLEYTNVELADLPLNFSPTLGLSLFLSGWYFSAAFLFPF